MVLRSGKLARAANACNSSYVIFTMRVQFTHDIRESKKPGVYEGNRSREGRGINHYKKSIECRVHLLDVVDVNLATILELECALAILFGKGICLVDLRVSGKFTVRLQ